MEQKIWQRFYDEDVPVSIPDEIVPLYNMLENAARREGKRTATCFMGARLSYRQLVRKVEGFAAALSSLGVKRGDRIALVLPNLPAYPIVHFAAMRLGAILVPTNPLYVERELEYQLNDSGAETVVIFDQLLPRLLNVRPRTRVARIVIAGVREFLPPVLSVLYRLKHGAGTEADPSQDIFLFNDLMRGGYPPAPVAPVDLDDPAIFLYTGGTTGVSKGAVLTHRNLAVNVLQTRYWLKGFRDGAETILCALPFFHSYGMTTALHLAIQSQATMVLLPRFDLADALKQIRRYRPTIFCGVPSMYNAINNSPQVRPEDVNSIRLCVSGGAGLPPEVQRRFEELTGGRLVEGYGLSETSPVAIVNPMFGTRKSGTIGVPISDTEARVVDIENRQTVPIGEVGELAIRGPQVMREYWNRHDETRLVLQDGWLYTGDMAVMDEDGFFKIVDRKKDIIVSAGFNVYPREVEDVIGQHPKVLEVAVVGVPSTVREEVVKAFIVSKPGESLSRAEVMQYCREKLSRYKMPKEIEFRDELPKSSVGKILKRILLAEEAGKRNRKGGE